jgi:hypothetical protein
MPSKPTKSRKGKVVKAIKPIPAEPAKVEAVLSPATEKRLDGIVFKQVRIETRTEQLAKQVNAIELTVGRMAKMLDEQLSRILTPNNGGGNGEGVVFHRRAFKKLSIKLRKRFIEVLVEDANGAKRQFRCSDWTAVTYLIANQRVREGIEEVAPSVRKVQQKRRTLARDEEAPAKPERRKRFTGIDDAAAQEQAALNRSREKAEKAIRKLRDASKKDQSLVDDLVSNGFTKQVAFEAADNCGRISDAYRSKFNSNK